MKKHPAKWCIAALLAHSLLAVSLLSSADPSPAPNDDRSVTLTHEEPDADEKDQMDPSKVPPLTGGGFVRRINKITRDMNATGGGTTTAQKSNTASADLPITVTPNIVQHKDQWTATMSVKGTPQLEIDSTMAANSQMQCLADKINSLSNISAWTHVLTKQEVEAMQSHYSVDLDASQVFADNVLLSKPKLVLTIRYKPVHIDPMVVYDQPMRSALKAKEAELGDAAAKLLADMTATRGDLMRSQSNVNDLQTRIDQRSKEISQNQADLIAASQQLEAIETQAGWNPKYDPLQAQMDPHISSPYVNDIINSVKPVAKAMVKAQKLGVYQDADNKRLGLVLGGFQSLMDKLSQQQKQYAALMQGIIDVLDHPVIKQVDVTADGELVCEKVYDPNAGTIELRRLQANANAADAAADRAKNLFDRARKNFDDEEKLAIAAGNKLVDKMRTNYKAQFAIGLGFNLLDLAMAAKNGGIGGVAVELAGKVAEGATQYAIESGYDNSVNNMAGIDAGKLYDSIYADMNINPDDPASGDALKKQFVTWGAGEVVSSRAKKLLSNSFPYGGAWIQQSELDSALKATQNLTVPAGGDSASVIASKMNNIISAGDAIDKMETRLEDLKSPWAYKLKDTGVSLAKEAAKTALSSLFNSMEQSGWEDYFNHEMRARALYTTYKLASSHYWDAMDWMKQADDMLQAYQKSHPFPATPFFRTTADKNFSDGAKVVVTATLTNPATSDMVFECTLQKENLPLTGPATFSEKLPVYVTREIEGWLSLKLKK